MNSVEEMAPIPPPPCHHHLLLSPQTTPFLPFLETAPTSGQPTPPQPCDGWPEFTFATTFDGGDLVVDADLLNECFSSAIDNDNSNAGEIRVDDDFLSAYFDVKKLEEKETTDIQNINNIIAGVEGDVNFRNGGGFVVEGSGGGRGRGRGRGGGRRKKENSKDGNIGTMKTAPAIKKREKSRSSSQSCLTEENGFVEPRKSMAPEDLAELWSVDPKRAKRIVANRHSAARSKERKAQYITELEENVKKLNSEVAFLNSRLIANQKETTELATEKSELKFQLQSMESQAVQMDAEIEAMKQDMEWLRSATNIEMDGFRLQTEQQHQPESTYFQYPPAAAPLPLLQNCQKSMLPPYFHVNNTQPLF